MVSDGSVEGRSDRLFSQPRPLTLLIACGIVLAAALLVVTGLVAGYLRQQTLKSSKSGMARLDAVLLEAGNRSLLGVEAVLSDIASHIRLADVPRPDAIARDIGEAAVGAHLNRSVEAMPQIAGITLIGADGTVVSHTGGWPAEAANVASRDYFMTLRDSPALESSIGSPMELDRNGGRVIPVAHTLRATGGGFAGIVVATLPVSDFESLYRAVPLGGDGVISLIRRDGTVLAQFPRQPGGDSRTPSTPVMAALGDGAQGVFEEARDKQGQWYIDAVAPLSDYPVSVVVSSSGAEALIGWSRQAAMFGAFAVCGVLSIGLMVVLIGRQIHTHSALAAIRAEKIESEHARLVAEAELLKKERLSVLGQFTATVANELRNPLSAIRNTLFTMREIAQSSGLQLDRPIARIQRSIARCDRIIGDLFEYIRTPELSRVTVNFDEWLREVLAEHGLPPAVTLVEQYQAGDAIVRIDADRIRRVVINLIDNAAQALGEVAPGDAPLRIAVKTAIGAEGIELTVSDTGPGIPAENMARIFEPLFSTKSFGAGLGLSAVKQIVVQHGGTITIDSAAGNGTSITIRLPAEPALKVAA
ncbi:MAG TPA: ATP-binding protein [Stellaceae bacterium]|nr:ATP-binding protein [Stellaceae bacterium]